MKKVLIVLLSFVAATPAFCGLRYDAKTWRTVRTYDVRTLSTSLESHMRELVAVRFDFRGKDVHDIKSSWSESSIWQSDPEQNGKFSNLRVIISRKDLDAFKSIPTSSSGGRLTVYGRVEKDTDSNYLFLRLLGRKVAVDSRGNATVSW